MSWRILYIEESTSIKLYLDNIKVTKNFNDLLIPLSDIHTIVIDNTQLNISIPLINKCLEYNISIIICSIEHLPYSIINPIFGNYKSSEMLKKQIKWNSDIKKILYSKIIKNKINNQIDILKKNNKSFDVINKLYLYEKEVMDGDIYNREGLSAKMYFKELLGKNFIRFDDDIVNAGLNYGYAILRSHISKTLIAKGLNSSLGIFHNGYTNQYNLSDDLIEAFRPIIDNYVYNNLLEAISFNRQHRLDLIKLTTNDVIINGTKQSLLNAISIYVDSIIDVFDNNDIKFYKEIFIL